MSNLWKNITTEGLKRPLSLSVSRKIGRGVIYDGNHRLTLLRNKEVEWIPVLVKYYFIEDDYNEKFPFVPRLYEEAAWPNAPAAETVGFEIRD